MPRFKKGSAFLGIFGHVNVDWIVDATTLDVVEHGPFFGGVAGNIAVGASRFGVPVRLASIIGRNFPKDYLKLLKDLKVDLKFLQKNDEVDTSTCRMTTYKDGNQKKEIFHGPQNEKVRFPQEFVDGLRYLHVSTGLPEACLCNAKQGRDGGLNVAFDPGADLARHYSEEDLRSVLECTDMFFVNEEELEVALGLLGSRSHNEILTLVNVLIVTKAEQGSLLISKKCETRIPAIKVPRVVDPTGAGDAYRSGLYAGLFRGYPMKDCCVLGAIAASECIQKEGAQEGLGSWAELEMRYKAIKR